MSERIAIDQNIHFGKPCIAGTRIPVRSILELVRDGISFEVIIQDYYPEISLDDVRACVQHAIDVIAAEEIRISPAAA